MKLNWQNVSITFLFFAVICLGILVVTRPVEVFEEKDPDESYITWVSHTEYIAGDSDGQAIVRISDYKGKPLNATCNLTLVYPNHTYVFTDAPMSPSIIYGNYYKVFTVPNAFGVYTEFVTCNINLRPGLWVLGNSSNSIHVNPAFDFLVNISQNITYLQDYLENFTVDVDNNFTYTNWLISQINASISTDLNYTNQLIINSTNNITVQINNTRNEAYTWYFDLRSRIYQCCERWADELNNLIPNNLLDVVPTGGGITQNTQRSLLDRLIGR
jgi:hypothetical protein